MSSTQRKACLVVQNSACILVENPAVHVLVKISSFAGGAALPANVFGGSIGGELVYGKGLFLGRSACLRGTWGARAGLVHRWTGEKKRELAAYSTRKSEQRAIDGKKLRRENVQNRHDAMYNTIKGGLCL